MLISILLEKNYSTGSWWMSHYCIRCFKIRGRPPPSLCFVDCFSLAERPLIELRWGYLHRKHTKMFQRKFQFTRSVEPLNLWSEHLLVYRKEYIRKEKVVFYNKQINRKIRNSFTCPVVMVTKHIHARYANAYGVSEDHK